MDLFELLGARRDDADADANEVAVDLDALSPDTVPVEPSDRNRAHCDALRRVIDPELGINIVDLGLVYAVEPHDGRVDVVLTMTTPACPLSAVIEDEVREALFEGFDDVDEVRVAVVFEPAWGPAMMSDAARDKLGR